MNGRSVFTSGFLVVALIGCTSEDDSAVFSAEAEESKAVELARADLISSDGAPVGSTILSQDGDRIVASLELAEMAPGLHAFHFHSVGLCEQPTFETAQGHLNPFDNTHGELSEAGKHLGDLPNIEVSQAGRANVEIELDLPASRIIPHLLDSDGTAVMLHEGPDDYRTDPSGAAGSRVACGVLNKVD